MQYAADRRVIGSEWVHGRAGQAVLRELLAPGAFVVAILISNYALSALPNVKLFDLLVFVAGYSLGLRRGDAVAVAAWLFYGSFNPWGATHPQLLVTLMASEVGYAAAGSLVRPAWLPYRQEPRLWPATRWRCWSAPHLLRADAQPDGLRLVVGRHHE